MTFSQLQNSLCDEILASSQTLEITIPNIVYDSRKTIPDCAFFAMRGADSDGHKYIPQAIKKGARIVVADDEEIYKKSVSEYPDVAFILVKNSRKALAIASADFFDNPSRRLKIIGITGTKGKTSTSYMIREILCAFGKKVGVIGTVGVFYADKSEDAENSTPESYELHRIFADMESVGIEYVVMEVSSQALNMYRVYGITFDIGVFTNISHDHIGEKEHKSFEEYFDCKKRLFGMCRRAVVNLDCDKCDEVIRVIKDNNIPYKTFGAEKTGANFIYKNEKFDMRDEITTSFDFNNCGRVCVNIAGIFSVYNAICAIAVCSYYGVSLEAVREGLGKVKVLGRMESVKHEKCRFTIIIDYAHNRASMQSLFDSVKYYCPNKIYCVFGCGGDRPKERRYDMGEIAGELADLSILTSDNPRSESVDDIIADILVGMEKSNGKSIVIKDRREAIFYALGKANVGDIVLLVGKGNQLYEEIGNEKIYFNEREVVREFFDNVKEQI